MFGRADKSYGKLQQPSTPPYRPVLHAEAGWQLLVKSSDSAAWNTWNVAQEGGQVLGCGLYIIGDAPRMPHALVRVHSHTQKRLADLGAV